MGEDEDITQMLRHGTWTPGQRTHLMGEAADAIDRLERERDALVSLLRALLHEPYVDEDGVVCVKRTTYGMGSDLADLVRPLLNGDEK